MKRRKSYGRRIVAFCIALLLCVGTGSFVAAANKADTAKTESVPNRSGDGKKKTQSVRTTLGGDRIADDNTMTTWEAVAEQSTQYTGRIWTDKSVFTEGVTLPASSEDAGEIKVEQGGSDFLVGLSALSSTSNMTTQSAKPLDIVLVLDTSGSMAYGMDGNRNPPTVPAEYEYEEVYLENKNDNNTYYIKVGDNWESVKWHDRIIGDNGWRYGGRYGTLVVPKADENDTSSDHVQFYKRTTVTEAHRDTRLYNMETAVKKFIDSTLEANQSMTGEEKHQLSVVTYASSATTNADLQEVTADTAGTLKNTVDGLNANGATNAGAGMTNANNQLENKGRANAQQVVIFFTDGTPTTGNVFDSGVANTAVQQAGEIKREERGGLVYSIGIFTNANADDLNSDDNQFMNAVSSNYPKATAYDNRGDRVGEEYQYYKTATEASELNQVFEDIFDEIKNPGSLPTEVVGDDPMNSGYITFEDELGAYMKVDDFKEIVFADQQFKKVEKTTSGNTDTYTFDGTVAASDLYPNGNLNEIVITVERSEDLKQGDKVKVQIPAALIPLRKFDVQETDAGSGAYTTTVTNTFPMRIFFGVSLKVDVAAKLENSNGDMQAYIEANTGDDGKVNFYSNDFTKDQATGNTTASFVPADTNSFYYFGQDSLLYIDEDCTEVATRQNSGSSIANKEYWYQRTYYATGETKPQTENIKITGDLAGELLQRYARLNEENQWYIPKDAPRLATIHNTYLSKESNKTHTAKDVINPQWSRNESHQVTDNVVVSLGNNGKLSLDVPATLEISKKVTAEDGLTAPDETFTFKVDLTAAQGTELKDSYSAQKFDKDGEESGDAFTLMDGGTVKLKAGEKVQIYGIAQGTTYHVTENELPAGFTQTTPADNNAEEGTIDEGINKAEFTNTYAVSAYTVSSADLGIKGTKTIKSEGDVRTFQEGDIFRFDIKASQQSQDAPLPTNSTDIIEPASGTSAPISFGDFTFTKAGEYRYSISEYLPNGKGGEEWDKIIAGITYDPTEYRLIISVQDNHKGELIPVFIEIAKRQGQTGVEDWEVLYESKGNLEEGTSAELPTDNESYINFVNTWSAKEQAISLSGKKTLEGKSLGDYSTKEQFGFKLEAAGSKDARSADEFAPDKDQPMPEGADGKYIYRNSTTGDITISGTTFKTENVGKEYKYTLHELQPTDNGKVDGNGIEGAKKNSDGKWVYKGITFDNEVKEITIKVDTVSNGDGTEAIQAQVTGNNFEFVNSYDASTTLALDGTKKITGRKFKSGDNYTFNITGENSAPLPKNQEGQEVSKVTIQPDSGQEAKLDFGTITFTQADMKGAVAEKNADGSTKQYTKDFIYTLTEEGTDGNGMTYDKAPKKVTITVTDDNHGTMKAVVKEGSEALTWTNKYTATGAVGEDDLAVTKVLNGRAMEAGKFHFTIKSEEGTPKLTKNFANEFAADGTVQTLKEDFGLTFDQDDVGETFAYVVDEVEDTDADGITYDKSEYRVAFTPKDNGDGTITPEIKVTKIKDAAGNKVEESVELTEGKAVIPFVNKYSTDPAITDISAEAGFTKAIAGRDWKDGDYFTFNITGTAQDGSKAPMPQKDDQDVTSVTVDYEMAKEQDRTEEGKETKFGFGTITFDKAGVYTYTVTEEKGGTTEKGLTYSANEATITITVEDKDGTGKLTATPAVSNPKFVNTYKAAIDYAGKGNIAIFKTLHGTNVKDDQFSFTVKAKDEATQKRLKIPQDGITEETNPAMEGQRTEVARLSPITFTESDAGKTYTFTVEEHNAGNKGFIYDDTVYEVQIAIIDLGEGKLQAVTTVVNTTDNKQVSETTWTTDSAAGTEPIALDFTNVYGASDDTSIKVTKEVTGGRPLKAGEFTFKLTTKPNNGGEGKEVATVTNKADGTVDFGTFTYTTTSYGAAEGAINLTDIISGDNAYATLSQKDDKNVYTVNYIASEVTTDLPSGMTAVTQPFDVTVTVTDSGDGTLTAEAATGKFINTYATLIDNIDISINGTKTIDTKGAEGLNPPALKDNFTFKLKALNGGPTPKNDTVKTDENGKIDFGTAAFNSDLLKDVEAAEDGSRTKVFEYEVSEIKGDLQGVTYDTTPKKFTVTLTDDGQGNLSAKTSAKDGQSLFAVTNTYEVQPKASSITDQISVQKVLEGRALGEQEFTFLLTENEDGVDKIVAKGTNDKDGKVTFGEVEYTKTGIHTYDVREEIPENAVDGVYEGVTYDKTLYTIQTTVTDNGDGTLKVTHVVKDDKDVTFTNKYEAAPTAVVINASKKLEGKKLTDGQFTFELRDEKNQLVGEAKKNHANGQVVFDEITYDQAGVYKYTVSEVNDKQERIDYDEKTYSVTVEVKDNGKGSYVAEVSYPDGAPSFVNTYEKPEEPKKPENPKKPDGNKDGGSVSAKTGDTAQTGAWTILMIAALVGIGAIIAIRRQLKKR